MGPLVPSATENVDRMRSLALDVGRQFAQGFSEGTELARSSQGRPDRETFVVGMGGSGIAGEFAQPLVHRESPLHFECLHGAELPAVVGSKSRVILVSYSGETWEVLRADEEAARRGARRIVMTSGGSLARRAEADGSPLLLLPPDLPPRSAIGFTFGGLLGFLDGGFPESLEARVRRAQSELSAYQPRVLGSRGLARRIVDQVRGRMPVVYGESALQPVVLRWAASLSENAKRLAASDLITEALHNSVVGWRHLTASRAAHLVGIVLEWGGTAPELAVAAEYLRRTIDRAGAASLRVVLPAEDLLAALLEGILLGDLVSLALAERDRVDPLPVDAVRRYRALGGRKRPQLASL